MLRVILRQRDIPLLHLPLRLCTWWCGEKGGFTDVCLYSHALSQFGNTIVVSSCNRFAAGLLEQGWCGTVAQVGREGVFLEADWEQHFWDERQGSAAPDQRGLSIQVSSFRWGLLKRERKLQWNLERVREGNGHICWGNVDKGRRGRTEAFVWDKDKKDKGGMKSWCTWVVGRFECKSKPKHPTCF